MLKPLAILSLAGVLLTGCSAINKPENSEQAVTPSDSHYSVKRIIGKSDNDVSIILSFSGGGTRAAALSYGVLEELHQTPVTINQEQQALVSEVDVISSVSGGSFTSAYYGLYQDKIFTDYKQDFLYQDVRDALMGRLMNPASWFSGLGRTGAAKQYYNEQLFGDATFADIDLAQSPYIIINASDITTGLRFSFIQEYFNLLCSDINDYPIANAVAASAAVPVLFEPIVLNNYDTCQRQSVATQSQSLSYRSQQTMSEINEYENKQKNQYIHLVDGGITDNLGLLAIYDMMELGQLHKHVQIDRPKSEHHVVVISVDASTTPEHGIGQSADLPSLEQTLNSVTDIQLHRYNDATKELFEKSMQRWAQDASNEQVTVVPHFIQVSFANTQDPSKRHKFNQVPTDLVLDKAIIDDIIAEGRQQLKTNPKYQMLLRQLNHQ